MTPASKAQLTRMLATFASAGDVDRFDVGALNHGTDQMSLREDWNRGQVWRAAGWMAARNATGSSIYVRPARALEAHPWALIDDLTAQALEKVRTDHPPAIVVETSPGNYQAWIRVQRAVPVEIRTAIARTLAQTYGGDLGGVGGHQFGRCPGTTNQKPTRRLPDGRAPFAALRHAGSEIATVEIPQSDTHPAPRPAPGAAGETDPIGRTGDQSRRDFAMACRLVEMNRSNDEIAAAIRAVRNDPKAHRVDYIERTIRAARRHVEQKKS